MKTSAEHHFKPLLNDLWHYGFMSALARMGGLLLLPLLTRALSVDNYGAVDVIAVFVALVSISIKMALPNGLVRYFGEYPDLNLRAGFVSTLLVSVTVFGLLVVTGVYFLSEYLARWLIGVKEYSVFIQIGCWIALLNSIASIPQMALRMERKIVAYNVPGLVYTATYVFLTFVFVRKMGIYGVFYAQLLAAIISLLLSLALTTRYISFNLSIYDLKHTLKYSLPLLPGLLSTWVNHQINRILLLVIVGLGGVAMFGAAAKIVLIVTFLLTTFQQGWQPYAMLIIHKEERNELYRHIFNYYSGGFAILAIILIAVSPELFSILLPTEYHNGYIVVPWLIGAAILHRSSALTRLGMLVSEKTAGISIASWAGVMLNVIISWYLIHSFGIAGAAIGSFVAELVFTSLLWKFSIKKSKVTFDTKAIIAVLVTYVICSIFILLISGNIESLAYSLMLRIICACVAISFIGYHIVDKPLLRFIRSASKKVPVLE